MTLRSAFRIVCHPARPIALVAFGQGTTPVHSRANAEGALSSDEGWGPLHFTSGYVWVCGGEDRYGDGCSEECAERDKGGESELHRERCISERRRMKLSASRQVRMRLQVLKNDLTRPVLIYFLSQR